MCNQRLMIEVEAAIFLVARRRAELLQSHFAREGLV
jgi:hypothetical protein